MSSANEPVITLTDDPAPEDTAVIADGLRAYNTEKAGIADFKPLAVLVSDPATGKVVGGLYGRSYLGQLFIDRFFLPEGLRRGRIGSRLLDMAEEEGRRRGCAYIALFTLEIQAPGFYKKRGYTQAATIACPPPGVNRYLMMKKI
jgi:GNAT superfamily N-acetyltransferase